MTNLHLDVLDFTTRTKRWNTIDELVSDFSALVERHGFPIFILTGLPSKSLDVEPLILANHWPAEWSDRYREQVYFADDPVSIWSRARIEPFRWLDAQRNGIVTSRTKQIAGEACDLGLADGYAFPLRDARGGAVVSLAAPSTIRHDAAMEASLFLASAYFWNTADRLVRNSGAAPRLTDRERELLTWTASGKSTWEIGCILSIAQSTVKTHLRSIRDKLGVANTTQAVAVALMSGEIQP